MKDYELIVLAKRNKSYTVFRNFKTIKESKQLIENLKVMGWTDIKLKKKWI